MEELRSTEILDIEIENDARKKVEKILKNAHEEAEKILENVGNKLTDAEYKEKIHFEQKIERFENNLKASLPLEQRRFLSSFYYASVSDAINSFLGTLSQEKICSILEAKLSSCVKIFSGKKVKASVFDVDLKNAEKLLNKYFKDEIIEIKEISFDRSGEEICEGNKFHSGIIITSADSSVKARITLDQILREIRSKYSSELASELFGGRLPE